MNFDFICKISLEICKIAITFAYELGLKSFLYEKSSTRKVTSKFNWGNPVKHFQNPQKPNRKKVTGLSRSKGKKIQKISNLLVAHHGCGAPLVIEKKLVLNFFELFFKKWYVIWPGSLKYFSKFYHSHEHEQSPRHQQVPVKWVVAGVG